jgi:hypothetical protein
MQTPLIGLTDTEKAAYQKWTIAFSLIYGAVFIAFACLIFYYPTITASDTAQVEGVEATGSIKLAAKKHDTK